MSWRTEDAVWECGHLTATELLVALAIAKAVRNRPREAVVTMAALAKTTRLCVRSVRRVVDRLEAPLQVFQVIQLPGLPLRFRPLIAVDWPPASDPDDGESGPPKNPENGWTQSPHPLDSESTPPGLRVPWDSESLDSESTPPRTLSPLLYKGTKGSTSPPPSSPEGVDFESTVTTSSGTVSKADSLEPLIANGARLVPDDKAIYAAAAEVWLLSDGQAEKGIPTNWVDRWIVGRLEAAHRHPRGWQWLLAADWRRDLKNFPLAKLASSLPPREGRGGNGHAKNHAPIVNGGRPLKTFR